MQNEVVEEKAKKPLSKKGILVRVLVIVLAAILLIGGGWWAVSAAIVRFGSGEFYTEDSKRMNTHITIEDIYVEDNALHYTVVNKTRFSLHSIEGKGGDLMLLLQTDEGWTLVYPDDPYFKGYDTMKWDPKNPICAAFKSIEGKLPLNKELQPGHYRYIREYYACTNRGKQNWGAVRVIGEFDIPAAS